MLDDVRPTCWLRLNMQALRKYIACRALATVSDLSIPIGLTSIHIDAFDAFLRYYIRGKHYILLKPVLSYGSSLGCGMFDLRRFVKAVQYA